MMSQPKEELMTALTPSAAGVVQAGDFDRAVLDELEEPFELIDIPLADIDIDRSRRVLNQVRLGLAAVNDEHVETLATVLEQGGLLPPGIVHRDPEGHLVILSGNHRFPAYKEAGRSSMPVYLATGLDGVATTDPRVQDVALRANVAHGDPVTTEHRIEQAARLVESGHYSIKEAARALRVPEGKLRDHAEKIKSRRRLAEAGVPLSDKDIPISVARRLNAIGSDEVLKKAAALVPRMAQKAEETNRLVVAINEARSERDQLAIIAEKAKELEAAGTAQAKARGVKGGALVSPKIRRLDGALSVVLRFDADELKATMPAEFRDRLRRRVDEAAQALAAMRGEI
jgi:ParB-like chromosome segregation protein Spo0J